MNVVQEYLECNDKSILGYWSFCHELILDTLKWATSQYKNNNFRMLIVESAEMNLIYPAINLDEYMPEGIIDPFNGWAFHVVLFDGKHIHDGWFKKQMGLKQYLKEMFPGESEFFLTCGPVQQVVNVYAEEFIENDIKIREVGMAC